MGGLTDSWRVTTFESSADIDFAGSEECDRSNTAMQIVTAGADCAGRAAPVAARGPTEVTGA
jgi:hypothetical protein